MKAFKQVGSSSKLGFDQGSPLFSLLVMSMGKRLNSRIRRAPNKQLPSIGTWGPLLGPLHGPKPKPCEHVEMMDSVLHLLVTVMFWG